MANNRAIEELLTIPSHSALITFQAFIRKISLKPQEIKIIQKAFTSSLKEKEKENCDLILEGLQTFIQKYHQQLIEWLYILIVKLTQRQSSASNDSHIRALQETTDLIRNVFPQRILLQLTCKFVMDDVQIINTAIKFNLLQFIRILVVSSKPSILENTFPDLIMAVSRIISWTADVKSVKVRKESERVIQKLFYLNPEKFSIILKSLPPSFQERAKVIFNVNSTQEKVNEIQLKKIDVIENKCLVDQDKNRNLENVNMSKYDGEYPKPGLFNRVLVPNDGKKGGKEHIRVHGHRHRESNLNTISANSATVTYDDFHHISHNLKKLYQTNKLLQCSKPKALCNDNSSHQIKEDKVKVHKSKKLRKLNDDDEIKDVAIALLPLKQSNKKIKRTKHINESKKKILITKTDIDNTLKDITNKLSRFNERHQERRLSLLSLIECINFDGDYCWNSHFKPIMSLLLETLGDNDSGTRKLALVSIQELAKTEPDRFQDQIVKIIEKLLQCFLDTDQGVIEAVKSCAYIFSCNLNVDTLWRTVNSIIVENDKTIQSVGLRFMSYIIKASTPVIVSCLLIETLSLLHKFTQDKNIEIRKNSIYCLIILYSKIGDKIWPNLKNFERPTVRLLRIYINRQ